MPVLNVHERVLDAAPAEVGAVLDSLASREDRLWPTRWWPPMRLDGPLRVGAKGGHGPVRYTVQEYTPGNSITFSFTGPSGFDGTHGFDIQPVEGGTRIRHTLAMRPRGPALLSWPLVFRPLHDALLEDALGGVEGGPSSLRTGPGTWSPYVRFLRWVLARRKDRKEA